MRPLVAIVSALIVTAPLPAWACFYVDCNHATLNAGPANLRVLVHVSDALLESKTPAIRLLDDAGKELPSSVTEAPHGMGVWIVSPTTPLTAGAKVSSEVPACTSLGGTVKLQTTVAPDAPFPTTLGRLQLSAPRAAAAGDLDCNPNDARVVDFELVPDATQKPWMPVTIFEVLVDGRGVSDLAHGMPSVGALKSQLGARCDGTGPVSPGPHRVEVRGWLAGRNTMLSTTADLDLSCATEGNEGPTGCSYASSAHGAWGLCLVALSLSRRRRNASA